MDRWIPLTQYAMEEGVSISTLRRKIKSNAIEYRLDDGRYLIRSNSEGSMDSSETIPAAETPKEVPVNRTDSVGTVMMATGKDFSPEISRLAREQKAALAEMDLKWRALEARLHGLSKKVDYLIEQNSELNMLVKVFEEKLNASM